MLVLAALALIPLLILGGVLVAIGTVSKSRWGINTKAVACPTCGAAAPAIRKPKSFREAMWGGWTCESCGTSIDKWGRPAH